MPVSFSILVIYILVQCPAFSQWDNIYTGTSSMNLSSIACSNDSTCFVGGELGGTGIILRTTNYGQSWDTVHYNDVTIINSIDFPTQDSGFACGYGTKIYQTLDGGATWFENTNHGLPFGYHFEKIRFANSVQGCTSYATGTNYTFCTHDAGQSWYERHQSNDAGGRDVFIQLDKLFLIDGLYLYRGNILDSIYVDTLPNISTGNYFYSSIASIDNKRVLVAGMHNFPNYPSMAISNDSGQTWVSHDFSNGQQFTDIAIHDSIVYMSILGSNTVNVSYDYGEHWVSTTILSGPGGWPGGLLELATTPSGLCYGVKDNMVYMTSNMGGTGTPVGVNDITSSLQFKVWPNPSNSRINITVAKGRNRLVEMYSSSGKLVYSSVPNQSEMNINVSDLPKGLYLIRQTADGISGVQKVIVE